MRRVLRGIGNVEEMGHHPGNVPLVMLTLLGAVSGGWAGAVIMFAVFCPFYLFGAWERGGHAQV